MTLPDTTTRVEENTAPDLNRIIQGRADAEVARLESASRGELSERIDDLGRTWDVERLLQLNASTLALTGSALGLLVDRRFLALPTVIFTFFLQHALQGWCPPIPVFRRLGVRTQREIERERFALKVLRGDFAELEGTRQQPLKERVRTILQAVDL